MTTTRAESTLPESHARSADGTRLYVRARPAPAGAPAGLPWAVFTDGILCDGYIWKYLWESVGARLAVAHWHYRGHGRSASPHAAERVEIAHHGDDLNRVRDHLGDGDVVLFGHSMGCQVVLEAYRARPERVRAMVLICGGYGRITETFHGTNVLSNVLPGLIERVDASPRLARALWSRIPPVLAFRLALLAGEIDPKTIRREDVLPYLSHMTHVDLPMFLRMLRAAGEHDAADVLPRVGCPTLIIAAENDSFTPASLAREMAERVPGAEFELLAGATHVAPLERRTEVGERVDEFLRARLLSA